ncbi:MAG: type I secretion system permease/ATPase [Acetobacteraceae bacterium]|jgi:ATP-binding cassette subfamily C protein/ATP-binding cassette subfamily C protein EexD|nr:type I secretion system permease/ATPase [Acetobacteraceae bacterium]
MSQINEGPPPNLLQQAVRACRSQFVVVGVFSLFVNLLMLTTSIYMMQVFDRVLATRSTDTLLFLTLIAIGATLLMALLEFARGQLLTRCAAWIEQTVAPEAFSRAIEAQLRNRPYRMEAMRDLAVCRGFVQSPGMTSLYDVPWVPIYLAVIFVLHPILGWIATAGAIILFLLTLANEWMTSNLLKKANVAAMAAQRRSESVVRNAEVIDSMGMLPNVLQRWHDGVMRMMPAQQSAADRAGVIMGLTKFFRLTVQIAVLGAGALLVLENALTAGAMIAGSIIMGRALAPVEQMIGAWKQLVSARQSYRRLSAHLTLPRIRPGGMPLPEPSGRLALERVTYAFPGTNVPIIKGVGFALEPGDSCAIIGPSAAGKTTLIRLVIGVLEPNAGTVRLDGANVFQWLREDFGRHVGYLPQDVELFDGTVVENIARMGTPDPDSVFAAAKLAGCHEMILKLPKGYETEIGESGTFLSGGQRQMIGLARALYGRPKLVVLDEPNSNLDGDGEQALLRALEHIKQAGTTVVLVSHRPALVQGVDKVVVLRDGMVEMFGPRQEVLKRLLQPARPTEVQGPGGPPRLDDRRAAP